MNLSYLGAMCLVGSLIGVAAAVETPPADSPRLIDPVGKEVVLKNWKIIAGVRKLNFLPDKPDIFEMREFGSTTFREGVSTLIPLHRIRSIKYDYEKETATVDVAGVEKPLQGTTRYKDINMITLTAEVDQGKSGVADLRYTGGLIKGGFREITFPGVREPKEKSHQAELFSFLVVPEGKGKSASVATARGIQALYRMPDGSEVLQPWLMFKKTLKIDISDIAKLQITASNVKDRTAECEVTKKDGEQLSLTLLATVPLDGKTANLVGLLGEVDAGWKLFPLHTFTEARPGEIKVEPTKQ